MSGEIYYANQLSFKIQSELNAAFNDIAPDFFLTVYGQSEHKMELKLNDPLNYKIKIPTDNQLLGGVITDFTAPIHADFIDVGGKNIKRLHFKISTSRNEVIYFHGVPHSIFVGFSIR